MAATEQCVGLEHQFDGSPKAYSTSASATRRLEGANLCASGKQAARTHKLGQALSEGARRNPEELRFPHLPWRGRGESAHPLRGVAGRVRVRSDRGAQVD
jgi:hypothetical protein